MLGRVYSTWNKRLDEQPVAGFQIVKKQGTAGSVMCYMHYQMDPKCFILDYITKLVYFKTCPEKLSSKYKVEQRSWSVGFFQSRFNSLDQVASSCRYS